MCSLRGTSVRTFRLLHNCRSNDSPFAYGRITQRAAGGNGQALRSLSVLRALASSAHRLCLISFAGKRPPDTLDPLSSYCEQIDLVLQRVANLSERSGYLNRAACMLSRKPYSLERFRSLEMR